MKFKRLTNNIIAVRLFPGDDPAECLAQLSEHAHIAGVVSGIGVLEWAEIGFFDLQKKQYIRKRFDEHMEMLALMGNISYKDGKPIVHLHTVLGRKDFSTIGGHFFAGAVSGTCEIIIIPWGKDELQRAHDEFTGLNLWDIAEKP